MKRLKPCLKRVFCLLVVLFVLSIPCFSVFAFEFNQLETEIMFTGSVPDGLKSAMSADVVSKIKNGESKILVGHRGAGDVYALVYVAKDSTKTLPRLYLVNGTHGGLYFKFPSLGRFTQATDEYFPCVRTHDEFYMTSDGRGGYWGHNDSSEGGILAENEYFMYVYKRNPLSGVWAERVATGQANDYFAFSATDTLYSYSSYKGYEEKITVYLPDGTYTEWGARAYQKELSAIMANWDYGVKILSPRDGFSQSQIDNMVVTLGFKVPQKPGTTSADLNVSVKGFTTGTGHVDSYESSTDNGEICGVMRVSGKMGFAENQTIKVTVTDAFGKTWTHSISTNCYPDFVDENDDGLDDRAGDNHFDRYDPGGNPNIDIASDLPGFIRGIKGFFTGLWGIIPEQLYIVIFGGLTLLIAVAIVRAVL